MVVPSSGADPRTIKLVENQIGLAEHVKPVGDQATLEVSIAIIEVGVGQDGLALGLDPITQVVA
ncbi:hypothetical protein D3C85_1899990 [compost metagenome]